MLAFTDPLAARPSLSHSCSGYSILGSLHTWLCIICSLRKSLPTVPVLTARVCVLLCLLLLCVPVSASLSHSHSQPLCPTYVISSARVGKPQTSDLSP